MRTKTTARAKRPRPEATPKGTATIMVLKMLGSAAAVFGGGGGGHSSSRALVAASASTSAVTSTRSLFDFLGGGVGSESRTSSSSAFVSRAPLLAGKTTHQQRGQQQHKRCSSVVQQRRPSTTTALTMSSGDPAGSLFVALSSRSSSRQFQHQLASPRRRDGPRLMSTAAGDGGDGRGFWTDDEGFEEPPSTFRDSTSTSGSTSSGGYDTGDSWETPPADAAEAGFLQEEEDEAEWMAGQDVDPEAEAIFFGDKSPFSDLGLSPALCGHLETLGLGHSTAVQVWWLCVLRRWL